MLKPLRATVMKNRYECDIVAISKDQIRVEPTADEWIIEFFLFTEADIIKNLILKSVKIKGLDITPELVQTPESLPVNNVKGKFLTRFLKPDKSTIRLDMSESFMLFKEQKFKELQSVEIKISPKKLPFKIDKGKIYPIKFEIKNRTDTCSFTIPIYVMPLPIDLEWTPTELHAHTTFSDGLKSPDKLMQIYKNKGYKVLYITDHTDSILNIEGGWDTYKNIANLSNENIAVYPGTEMTVYHKNKKGRKVYSDILAYGICDLKDMKNNIYTTQEGIENILKNNPGLSSCAIAHPYHILYPWKDWSVKRYGGIELIAGYQTNFFKSQNLMTRWQNEVKRLLGETFKYGYFPSVRAGGDYHCRPIKMMFDFVTYIKTPRWDKKYCVDRTIYLGKTVASYYGGLTYFKLKFGNLKAEVGDIIRDVPKGSLLRFIIVFKPIKTGKYIISLNCGSKAKPIYHIRDYFIQGKTYLLDGYFKFPGKKQFYYLYINGKDIIITSPIFMSG